MSKWCGDENCLQCVDKEPDPYVHLPREDYDAIRAENQRLQQLLEDVLHTFGYLRFHRVAGMDGLLYETHSKMSPERTVEACEKRIRATLAAQAAGQGGLQ